MIYIAYAIAVVIPLLALAAIYWFDVYKTGQFKIILASFGVGIIAFVLASEINKFTIGGGYLERMDVIRYSAPILEEILKGAILFYLVRRANFTYFVEGAVYGFAVGIGFAVVENFQYINAAPDASLIVAGSRVVSTNLIHAATSSVLGIILGRARFERGLPRQALFGLAGMLIAMVLHVAYNNLVTRVDVSLLLIFAIACGAVSAGVIAYFVRSGFKEARAMLEESLGMADRVTSGEAAVVTRMDTIDTLLKPMRERFGDKKAEQIRRFLLAQARMGLLRKSLEKLDNESMKRSIEQEISKLRVEIDEARREVGSYAMLYLRHTIPEDASPLWGRLEAVIQERAAAPKQAGGMNLWANLQNRQQEQKTASPNQETEE